jgi:16S rRNA (uracil1498-N3)-methyltransferase
MILFYAPDIIARPELPETESQHCVRVLRRERGDTVHITDGKGYFYEAIISEPHPKHCQVTIVKTVLQEPLWTGRIEIALAPTKSIDRTEWFAEKATEIGINKISFLKTRFSERKDIKLERITNILVAALKQSMKASLPELQGMTPFETFIRQPFEGQKFIAHCYPGEKKLLSQSLAKNENVLVLIGPEGDFSEEEVSQAITCGFQPISLGESRLRTETAALTACQTIHITRQLL